jgi:ketosteroid isomerase-like protein
MAAHNNTHTNTHTNAAESEIRAHVGRLIDALRTKDLELVKPLYANDVVSFDVEPPLQHVGINAKSDNWARAFGFFEVLTYEIRDLSVVAGDDVAFAYGFGRLGGTLKNGAATDGMWVRATFCLRKINGEWLIVHDQASVPFDIASGQGVTDLEP